MLEHVIYSQQDQMLMQVTPLVCKKAQKNAITTTANPSTHNVIITNCWMKMQSTKSLKETYPKNKLPKDYQSSNDLG